MCDKEKRSLRDLEPTEMEKLQKELYEANDRIQQLESQLKYANLMNTRLMSTMTCIREQEKKIVPAPFLGIKTAHDENYGGPQVAKREKYLY